MLTYINVSAQNEPFKGCIAIKSTSLTDNIGEASSIIVSRKCYNDTDWSVIRTVSLDSAESLSFELFDYSVKSGTSYSYNFDIMKENDIVPIESGMIENIDFTLDGLFVGNSQKQYIACSNFKTEVSRNNSVEYAMTVASKYPYAISNSALNYSTGKSSGLFMHFDDNMRRFVPDNDHSYATEILDFLTDGTPKIIKTHAGQIWYVSINANPKELYSDYIGMHLIEFSWTEIGELPISELVGV